MNDFLTISIVGSIILTVLLNLLPVLFPNAADKIQKNLEEHARNTIKQHDDNSQPSVKIFFPWKVMLIVSIVLTVLINIVGNFAK